MMRRAVVRTAAMLFAILLAAEIALPSAAALDSVYFTAINETILPLSDSTMPFWSDGYLYVSSSTFSGGGLGIYYSRNTIKQTLVLYTYSKALIFHLDTDTVGDNQGNGYWPPAVTRGNRVFLPVSTVADYFGLTYTYSRVSHGYLIRVRSSESVLSDNVFVDAACSQLSSRYSQYLGGGKSTSQPSSAAQPGKVVNEVPETTEVSGKLIYLCFQADGSKTGTLVKILKSAGAAATVFFTEKQIRANGDLVRQTVASGQAVGLLVNASGTAEAEKQLNAANDALFRAAAVKTRLCMIKGGGEARAAAESAGYCCMTAQMDRASSGLRSASGAETLMRRITARSGSVTVWLGDGITGTGLRKFLAAVEESGDGLAGLTELTA